MSGKYTVVWMDNLNPPRVLLKENGQYAYEVEIPKKVGVDKKGLRTDPPALTELYNAENESRRSQLQANIDNWKSSGIPPQKIISNTIDISLHG